MAAEYEAICHTFEPVYDAQSRILILGSFPSVKSREQGFYYGHPQNRFWKVLAAILCCQIPKTIEEKKKLLLEHHIAIWDVIKSCEIKGSRDSSIRNVVPIDIKAVMKKTKICRIYANGKKAESLYKKYILPKTKVGITVLPSTSPANAACSLEKLVEVWGREILGDNKQAPEVSG
ncbi:MAG: DNA-deoxyinosine glycosylase [Lachnospiraceae bacterium]|nr:DNA-deoxyinosine glycosylase [Lachnospiraceae bacterium]